MVLTNIDLKNVSLIYSKICQKVPNGKGLITLHVCVIILWPLWITYFNYLVSVTAGGPESPRGHM